ncbi:MAG: hypothetical protein EG825_00190 [Rhodocyclaceae bacterium]|nr:hypothetical protein [Rhodocyclaceae bacterium]
MIDTLIHRITGYRIVPLEIGMTIPPGSIVNRDLTVSIPTDESTLPASPRSSDYGGRAKMKPHPNTTMLRRYQKWRRGECDERQIAPITIGEVLDWAISACEAADILVNNKGKNHDQIAYRKLEEAVNGED